MYKIVFCDIDGTLLNSKSEIQPSSIKAINMLKEKDIHFVLSTARTPGDTFTLLDEYNLKVPVITANGGYILDENRNVLSETLFESEDICDMWDYLYEKEYDLAFGIYTKETWYTPTPNDYRMLVEEKIVHRKCKKIEREDLSSLKICKAQCICTLENVLYIQNELTKRYPNFNIALSSGKYIEISAHGASKILGVKKYCEIYNINKEDCIAFGDSQTDIDTLSYVGNGYLMGNAPKELKEIIKKQTKSSNEDGIYYALHDILNII